MNLTCVDAPNRKSSVLHSTMFTCLARRCNQQVMMRLLSPPFPGFSSCRNSGISSESELLTCFYPVCLDRPAYLITFAGISQNLGQVWQHVATCGNAIALCLSTAIRTPTNTRPSVKVTLTLVLKAPTALYNPHTAQKTVSQRTASSTT